MPVVHGGADEVTVPRSIFSKWNGQGQSRLRQPVTDLIIKHGSVRCRIDKFKYEQQIFPDNSEARKLNRSCVGCFPHHAEQLDEEVRMQGIINLLHMHTTNEDKFYFVRLLASWFYVWETASKSAKELRFVNKKEIFEDATELLTENSVDVKQKLLQSVLELYVPFSGAWGTVYALRIVGWILRKVFTRLCDGICVHLGEVELLERAHQTDLPIIYIPSYRSDLDPFVLFFTLQSLGIRTPYFFSTRSQRFLAKFIGGFGFRGKAVVDVPVRKALTESLFRSLVKKRTSICLNLEQQRTRSGKASVELYGMEFLSILYDSWSSNVIEDAFIVPINVSYERLPEHLDQPSFLKSNSFFYSNSLFKKLQNYWKYKLGFVRVCIGQPFTLREFKISTDQNSKFKTLCDPSKKCSEAYQRTYLGSELCWDSKLNPILSASLSSLYDISLNVDNDEKKYVFVDSLGYHAIYASTQSAVVMSTNLVAFLLLKKFRSGVRLNTLCKAMQELVKWFQMYKKDAGFTGCVRGVVMRALEILGNDTLKITNIAGSITVQPILTAASLERLAYYSNTVMPYVAMESVVAITLFALVGNKMATSKGLLRVDVKVCDFVLIPESRKVYEIFSSEFYLHSPCLSAKAAIHQAFERLNEKNLVLSLIDESRSCRARHPFEDEYFHDDDDEMSGDENEVGGAGGGDTMFVPHEYKVVNSDEAYSTLSFLRDLLVPYLEIYAAVTLELEGLISKDSENNEPVSELEFMEKALGGIKSKFPVEEYGELLTLDVLRTCLFAFEEHAFIEYKVDHATRLKTVSLNEYYTADKLRAAANKMLHFVTY